MIDPGTAPGALVFIVYDRDDRELHRLAVPASVLAGTSHEAAWAYIAEQAELQAALVAERGAVVCVFDGDTGAQWGALGILEP